MKNYLKHKALFALFVVIILFVFIYPNDIYALSLTPTRFELRGDPGEIITQEMFINNETGTAETYYSSFANFEAQGESGSPAFTDPKDDLGTWMSTDISSVYLPSKTNKIVPFTITIPKDAEPGGHFAVIFWGTTPAGGDTGVSVGAKTGILVLLSVSGDVKEEAGLLNFNTKDNQFLYNTLPVSFEYRFKNAGGDRIKPQGKITIRDTIFFPADYVDANEVEGNVLPGSTRKFNIDWIKYERPASYVAPTQIFKNFFSKVNYQWKNFAMGLYSANLNLEYGLQAQHVQKTIFFFVFPWQLIIVMTLVLFIVLFGGWKIIKRYNKYIINKARSAVNITP